MSAEIDHWQVFGHVHHFRDTTPLRERSYVRADVFRYYAYSIGEGGECLHVLFKNKTTKKERLDVARALLHLHLIQKENP